MIEKWFTFFYVVLGSVCGFQSTNTQRHTRARTQNNNSNNIKKKRKEKSKLLTVPWFVLFFLSEPLPRIQWSFIESVVGRLIRYVVHFGRSGNKTRAHTKSLPVCMGMTQWQKERLLTASILEYENMNRTLCPILKTNLFSIEFNACWPHWKQNRIIHFDSPNKFVLNTLCETVATAFGHNSGTSIT